MGKSKKWQNNIKKSIDVSRIEITENFTKIAKRLAPGQMSHALIKDNGKNEFCFLIKEEQSYLKSITYNPILEQGLVQFVIGGVFVVVYMIKVNNNDDTLYETWCNYHNPVDGVRDIELLAAQEDIKIVMLNQDGEIVKIYEEKNICKMEYIKFTKQIINMKPWSMEAYNFSKIKLSNELPSITALWEHMQALNLLKELI